MYHLIELTKNGFKDLKITLIKSQNKTKHSTFSLNSKYSYFNKLIAALNQAVKEEIIPSNPAYLVEPFPQDETQREFLTYEELLAMVNAPYKNQTLRHMFLFSCLTGLRWGDVEKLLWSEMQHSNELGYYIRFKQAKTSGQKLYQSVKKHLVF